MVGPKVSFTGRFHCIARLLCVSINKEHGEKHPFISFYALFPGFLGVCHKQRGEKEEEKRDLITVSACAHYYGGGPL